MKFILFCKQPYAFSILKPLEVEILKRGYQSLWYVPKKIIDLFPYTEANVTSDIKDIKAYKSDAIFVPGNEVPHFLQGVKVQIFHGMAGEKKGHFRIRDYFDLYLTQGPYFTKKFNELKQKHKNFEVQETGWCKLDALYKMNDEITKRKNELLKEYNVKKVVLYAPTFSPSLTSAPKLYETIEKLSKDNDILVIIKFHDLMDEIYKEKFSKLEKNNLLISKEKDILNLMKLSDMMISDTSSVVYEYILLDKPVVTLDNKSNNDAWHNLTDENDVLPAIYNILTDNDVYKDKREDTIKLYHPYSDALSSKRMIDAAMEYIDKFSVPKKRELSLLRKYKIYKEFGIN